MWTYQFPWVHPFWSVYLSMRKSCALLQPNVDYLLVTDYILELC